MEGYKKIERTSVPDQIVEQLKKAIIAGKWQPGDSLPSENMLAEEFGVSRMSVRAAIKKLETYGLVEVRMGEVTFVIDFDPAVFLKGLSPIFSKPKSALEIIEFRKALEVECIKLAVKRADAHDLEVLEHIYNEYWKATSAHDTEKTVTFDYRFHHQVFLMSKNNLFREIYEAMSELFFLHIDRNEQLYLRTYGALGKEEDSHAQVLSAMKRRQTQEAVDAYAKMINELIAVYQTLNGDEALHADPDRPIPYEKVMENIAALSKGGERP